MLAIGIDYLNGWAMATDVANRAVPEWPPHPDRVFMALVAAHFETDGDAAERGVLKWLESLPTDFGQPVVLTSDHRPRTTVTTFVPVNDERSPIKKNKALMPAGSLLIGRDRQPRTFPLAIPSDCVTYLAWDRVEPTEEQRRLLDQLCRKVTSVGHSASLVRMWVAEEVPIERTNCGRDSKFLHLVPSAGASQDRLRVFGPGRLADLESRHNRTAIDEFVRLQSAISSAKGRKQKEELKAELDAHFGGAMPASLRPTPSLWHGYERAEPAEPELDVCGSHFSADLFVLRQVRGRRFGLESTLMLTEALRNCALGQCPKPLPEWLSGHQASSEPSQRERGHVAFLPLPHIGRRHAEGHLLGLAIAVPRDVSRRELAQALQPLLFETTGPRAGWPREIQLTFGSLGECVLELVERDESRQALQATTWTAAGDGATRWATVTPFALDRHTKSKEPWAELEDGVAAACGRIGLPRPGDVSVMPVSMFEGAPPVREMPRLNRKSGGLIRQVHAAITFPEPVVGPVLIGAGRYRGYGLCRPLRMENLEMTVQAHQFTEFFHAAHGYDPFPWQGRLASRVAGTIHDQEHSNWPECLALPTGSGKTACIDIAVFALACQAAIPANQRTAPRRILFVVDRSVIVDEAFEHAVELAKRLDGATSGILSDVAEALRTLGGQSSFAEFNDDLAASPPLTCHQLRGGMYRDEAWARTPTQPCVICSTVDQIGSRLLFRGYGSSFKVWPVHAGLAGNDSLVILDEAHCSQPFLETMQWITRYRGDAWAELPVARPFAFTIMSATPPAATKDVFCADESDRQHDVLGPRIRAAKPATLHVAEKAKGKQALAELASELAIQAAKYATAGHRRIGILVNRVETARRVAGLLQAVLQVADGEETPIKAVRDAARALKPVGRFDVELLTGRMRPIDRDDRLKNWQPSRDPAVDSSQTDESSRGLLTWLGTKRNRPDVPWPVFVVATQSLEVGANLDFEALVTECASLDALRQRFGRLNRIARSEQPAPATIVIRQDQTPGAIQADDPVYASTLSETWRWLRSQAVPFGATNDAASEAERPTIVDFGIAAMDILVATLAPERRPSLMLQGKNAPVMLPSYVDCWAQTDPEPMPSPNVALFLHGPQQNAPEIQVCWRADLPRTLRGGGESEITPDDAIAAVAMSPPTTLECMPAPLHVFVKWWRNDCEPAFDLSDVSATANADDNVGWRNNRVAVVWRGPPRRQRNQRDAKTSDRVLGTHCLEDKETLRPGDTVVLPVAAGGWEVFGHIPPECSFDVADRCHLLARRRAVLRLHPNLLKHWPTNRSGFVTSLRDELAGLLRATDVPDERDVYERLERLRGECESVRDSLPPNEQWLADSLTLLRGPRSRSTKWSHCNSLSESPGNELVPVWQIGLRSKKRWTSNRDAKDVERTRRITLGETESHEDDDSSDTDRTTLTEHSTGVSRHAKAFAAAAGLPDDLQRVFELAGDWHDLGKADQRFQAFLFGGSHLLASAADELFAKSAGLRETIVHDRGAARDSELPAGFRHELVSFGLLEHCEDFRRRLEQLSAEQRDLVLHFVTVHHGHGRPFAPIVHDELLLRPKHPDADELLAIDLSRAGFTVNVTPDERRRWPPPHRLDSGIAERFWRLVRRYGWWGLAWLESLFVLADHRQSELEASRLGESEPKLEESTR